MHLPCKQQQKVAKFANETSNVTVKCHSCKNSTPVYSGLIAAALRNSLVSRRDFS